MEATTHNRQRFCGKVALVTGGVKGIGRAIVESFLEEGAKVCVADIDEAGGLEMMEELKSYGENIMFVKCDVGEQKDVTHTLNKLIESYKTIDILVNDAAVQLNKPLLETTTEEFEGVMKTNLTSTFMFTRDVAKIMIAQSKGGSIINFSSTFAIVGSPGYIAYHASKGGIASFTRAAAIALLPYNIRVNSIAPGTTMTPGLIDGARDTGDVEKGLNSFMALQPMKRFGEPKEIANAVLFLASSEASFVVGSSLVADGAYTII